MAGEHAPGFDCTKPSGESYWLNFSQGQQQLICIPTEEWVRLRAPAPLCP